MKGLSVVVAVVLSFSLAIHRPSAVVLKVWPKGPLVYLGEPIVLTCEVKRNSSEVWVYSWIRHNASIPTVSSHTYSISALTSEDNGTYQCGAQEQHTNSTLLSNTVSLSVITASPPALLEVWPESSQHVQGGEFSLNCSVHSGKTSGWTLKRFCGAKLHSDCLESGGKVNRTKDVICSFNNITAGLNGLYWCASGDQRSKAVNITVSGEENTSIAAWVWIVCVIVIILLLIPITFLLVPSLRQRVKFFSPCGEFNPHQEMPRTKQDVTEIQWDLAWMEMSNLLDKPNSGS